MLPLHLISRAAQRRPAAWIPLFLTLGMAAVLGAAAALLAFKQPELSLAVLGAPFFALMVCYPRYTFYALAIIFPLTIGMPRGTAGIPILRPAEAFLVVSFTAVMLSRLFYFPWRIEFSLIDLGMFVLFISGIVIPLMVAIWRGQTVTTDNMNVLVGPLRFYMFYLLARTVITERAHVRQLIHISLAVSLVIAAISVCQKYDLFGVPQLMADYFMDASTRAYVYSSWRDPTLFRASSVFNGSWNTLGSYMSFTLLIAIFYAETVRTKLGFVACCVVIALDGLSLMLSGNVSSTAALIGGIVLGSLYLRRLPRAVVPLAIGVVLASLFFGDFVTSRFSQQFGNTQGDTVLASSFTDRIELWVNEFLPALRGNEILGVGLELPDSVWWGTEESQYLYLLYKGGFIYLIGYVLWALLSLGLCISVLRCQDKLARMLAMATAMQVIGLMYMGISNAYATYSAPMANMWIMFALVSTVHTWAVAEDTPQPVPVLLPAV